MRLFRLSLDKHYILKNVRIMRGKSEIIMRFHLELDTYEIVFRIERTIE